MAEGKREAPTGQELAMLRFEAQEARVSVDQPERKRLTLKLLAAYDAAIADNADNAERVRELEHAAKSFLEASDAMVPALAKAAVDARIKDHGRIAELMRQLEEERQEVQLKQAALNGANAAVAEARSIADRPLGTHIDYEPMDMIRDLQKALGTQVHDREPCRCGNVKALAEARATIERVRKVLVRYAGKTGIHRCDIEDALDPQNIPEMPLAKGDVND